MSKNIQYITNEIGARTGVLLDLPTYQKLTAEPQDPELLVNLSDEELVALAGSKLSLEAQTQLDDLLSRNQEHHLSATEEAQLDRLLNQVDSLNILKTRAQYTLTHLATISL